MLEPVVHRAATMLRHNLRIAHVLLEARPVFALLVHRRLLRPYEAKLGKFVHLAVLDARVEVVLGKQGGQCAVRVGREVGARERLFVVHVGHGHRVAHAFYRVLIQERRVVDVVLLKDDRNGTRVRGEMSHLEVQRSVLVQH